MLLLTLRDLQHRAVRFVVVTLLASVVFTLLFLMTGLVAQFHYEPKATVDAFGATAWIVPAGVSGPFTAAATMPVSTADAVIGEGATPAVIARSSMDAGSDPEEVILIGHVPGGLGTPPVSDGRPAEQAGEVVVDSSADADVGDQVVIAGQTFEVVGTSDDTTLLAGIPLVFVPITDAQELVYRSDQVVSVVLVDGDPGPLPEGVVAMTPREVSDDAFGPLESAVSAVDLVRALLWIVAAVIIGAVVYLSALERQRDFAVLKAMGVRTGSLLGGLALQAVLVSVAAVVIGMVLQALIAPTFPLPVRVTARAFITVPIVATIVAMLAGAVGMRRVARSDPALAFAGAGG